MTKLQGFIKDFKGGTKYLAKTHKSRGMVQTQHIGRRSQHSNFQTLAFFSACAFIFIYKSRVHILFCRRWVLFMQPPIAAFLPSFLFACALRSSFHCLPVEEKKKNKIGKVFEWDRHICTRIPAAKTNKQYCAFFAPFDRTTRVRWRISGANLLWRR